MSVLPVRVFGEGAPVLLVHGVGLGAEYFKALAHALAEFARVIVPDRRGYAAASALAPASFDDNVGDLLDTIDALDIAPVVWVGVSGGATLGIAAMCHDSHRIRAAVLHEPLLGGLAPTLQRHIADTSEQLAADDSPRAVVEFMRQLLGPATWEIVAHTAEGDVRERAALVRGELAEFAAATFTVEDLTSLQERAIVTTLGTDSSSARDEAARVLARHADAEIVVVPGGHFVPIDAPDAIAALVESLVRAPLLSPRPEP
jgi:3-oxoadipate enol-lactonase